ncbi:MAG: sulfite reductase flavoprotein subunit alpha [Pseudomonadota bacterium]
MSELPKPPQFPEGAPFNDAQRVWLAGFLAGVQSRAGLSVSESAGASTAGAAQAPRLDILFGTQTGNAETVARDAAVAAQARGFAPKVAALDDISVKSLAAMEQVIIVISTYGEGEMPDNAQLFWDALSADAAPRLEALSYGVVALGDTGYSEFCQAGKLMDMRLEQLGAKRLTPRVDCDVDYEDDASAWVEATLPLIADIVEPQATLVEDSVSVVSQTERPKWNRKNPFHAPTLENRLLSGAGSGKEIRHFAFDLSGSELTYEAGDALGVIPTNSAELVELLLERFGVSADTTVPGLDAPLGDALRTQFEISTPSRELVATIGHRSKHDELKNVLANGDKDSVEAFLWGRDTLDLLTLDESLLLSVQEFVGLLKPLQHRAYSISSSPKARQGEVHLTVAAVRWEYDGRPHRGVCSTFMSDQLGTGHTVPLFISPNRAFRVPENDDAPMIMVGPGTGIAPFRAFLEERRERGAQGRNWLFFGDQTRVDDFIYEEQISRMSADGLLTRLDLAFSRDQREKIYVQTRMRENGKALFSWLEEGGYFYVCGDATRMARGVDEALLSIVSEHGALSADDAAAYVSTLKREKRYLRDVY